METNKKGKKLTFWSKDEIKCPACGYKFHRERLLTGRGRLIAGPITDELRRTYKPSKEFGKVYPIIYVVTVCPACFYASFVSDFDKLDPSIAEKVKLAGPARKENIKRLFNNITFKEPVNRDIYSGTAAYILALDCYNYHDKYVAPTLKKAIASLRTAWLFGDLSELEPDNKRYKKMDLFFHKKALEYYRDALNKMQTGAEEFGMVNMGPDVDKNYGYEGVLYLNGILTLKYGTIDEPDPKKRLEKYQKIKTILSRLFGDGKSSKARPSAILDMTRDVYDKINEMIEEMDKENNPNGV